MKTKEEIEYRIHTLNQIIEEEEKRLSNEDLTIEEKTRINEDLSYVHERLQVLEWVLR